MRYAVVTFLRSNVGLDGFADYNQEMFSKDSLKFVGAFTERYTACLVASELVCTKAAREKYLYSVVVDSWKSSCVSYFESIISDNIDYVDKMTHMLIFADKGQRWLDIIHLVAVEFAISNKQMKKQRYPYLFFCASCNYPHSIAELTWYEEDGKVFCAACGEVAMDTYTFEKLRSKLPAD